MIPLRWAINPAPAKVQLPGRVLGWLRPFQPHLSARAGFAARRVATALPPNAGFLMKRLSAVVV